MTDWMDLSRRAALASHRLIGWIYWDPTAVANYAALGVPEGLGYYVATRAAPLGVAGADVVTAVYGSIHRDLVGMALDLCAEHTTFAAAAGARDAGVTDGLRRMTPELCDGLAGLAEPLWAAADSLPLTGRALFAAHRSWPRPSDDDLLSAWLAVNCIREWRGDTHWAIQVAEELDGTMAGILDGAWRNYPDDWLPRSRGADDVAVDGAFRALEERGLAVDGVVTAEGIAYRQALEDRLDRISAAAWRVVGEAATERFLRLVEPVGLRFVEAIDRTAGPRWMPAARDRVPPVSPGGRSGDR